MQPDWRTAGPANDKMSREGAGGWEKLRRPGKNGILIVLLTLWWWKAQPLVVEKDWLVAVDDVRWVLEVLLSLTAQKRTSESEGEPGPTSKRLKRS